MSTAPSTSTGSTPKVLSPEEFNSAVASDLKWNSAAVTGNAVFCGVGMTFVNSSTVIPSLISQLTSSTTLVGLAAAVESGAWLAPQLLAASYVNDKPLKKPYVLAPALLGRLMYPLLAIAMLILGGSSSNALLVVFFICFTLFTVGDSLCVVPWMDLLAKIIPISHRGKVLGVSQTMSYGLGIAIGPVVGWILSSQALGFPANYSALFALSGVGWLLSWASVAIIREPPQPNLQPRQPFREFIGKLSPILRGNGTFRRLLAVRLLVGIGFMSYPFYVVYAREVRGLDAQWIGFFVSAQMAGAMLSAIGFGALCDRVGTRAVIITAVALATVGPLLALASGALPLSLAGLMPYLFAVSFATIGMLMAALTIGFMNFLLEASPAEARPTYVGLFNTICGSLLAVPPLLGWLVQVTSFSVVFTVAAACFVAGLFVAFGLRDPRWSSARAAS